MKKFKKILNFLLLSLLLIGSNACVSNVTLPTIYLETDGEKLPDRSDPRYKDYAPVILKYKYNEEELIDVNGKARIRGTSSRWFDKKGYKIKFSTPVSLVKLPSSKKYNLIASFLDPTLLRDYLALSISYSMNTKEKRYAPRPILTNVVYDEKDYGLFYLIDDIDVSTTKIQVEIEVQLSLTLHTGDWFQGPHKYQNPRMFKFFI